MRCARRGDDARRTHALIAFVTFALALRSAVECAAAADGVFTSSGSLASALKACKDLDAFATTCYHGAVPIADWNVGEVDDMEYLFDGKSTFNQNISAWNTASVETMYGMFYQADAFNQDISAWNTASVTDMSHMFYQALAFNQDISAWNTANVEDMDDMFRGASAFNQDITGWDSSSVKFSSNMFQNAIAWLADYKRFDDSPSVDGPTSNWYKIPPPPRTVCSRVRGVSHRL